jgi:hypothetical protein
MKSERIIRRALAGILTLGVAAASGQALAASTGSASPHGSMTSAAPFRAIDIGNGTRHINVTRFETVALRSNGHDTNWTFDTLNTRSFPLSSIVPGADGVTVYVMESPLYIH